MVPQAGDMHPMSRHMIGMSGHNAEMPDDMSAMPGNLALVPDDMEAMTENYLALSPVSLLKALDPLLLLRALAAKLWYGRTAWYWRTPGLSVPVLGRIHVEVCYVDMYDVDDDEMDDDEEEVLFLQYRKAVPASPSVHPLLAFLVVEKVPGSYARHLFASLQVLARKVLGSTEPKQFWTLLWQYALQSDSGRRPLSPRPPPFAAC
jgi:hypothetical protein